MEKVSIMSCDSYDYSKVEKAVFECIDNIEGIKDKLKPGVRVLVKTNLLMRKNPEEAVTTHPAVVEAIVRYLQNLGCVAVIGDSPGGPYSPKLLKMIYTAAKMTEVAQKTGCELNYNTEVEEVKNGKARLLKTMQIIKIARDVDYVISAAKLKTHGMMTYTGAVKNLFGVIPGLIKADYHFKMNNTENFAGHLVDICEYINPLFSVIDGIDGMEGDGPSAGEKRHVGLIMASKNPYALDAVACSIIGLTPLSVPTVKEASERKLFSGKLEDISIIGVPLEKIKIKPFKLPSSVHINFVGSRIPKSIQKFVLNTFRPIPVFDYTKCVGCGDCKTSCPANIIDMSTKKPVADLNKCIRCFCCHELCPKKAINIKRHWLHRVIFK